MRAVDVREQVVVGTNVSAVVVMVMAFVTAAFVVVVMIIGHMCEYYARLRSWQVNVTITKTGFNEIDINKTTTKTYLLTTITKLVLHRTKTPHFVSFDTVDVAFSCYTHDALM